MSKKFKNPVHQTQDFKLENVENKVQINHCLLYYFEGKFLKNLKMNPQMNLLACIWYLPVRPMSVSECLSTYW